jgi:hypothetical protein
LYSNLKFLFLFFFFVILSSCASLTGFQDGRAIGEGNFEIMGSANTSKTPAFKIFEDESEDFSSIYYPSLEFGAKFGATDKLDVTFRLNTTLNTALGAKYQFLGTPKSRFAVGTGVEFGSFGLGIGLWNIQVPIYTSFHPSPMITLYASPKFIHQFTGIIVGPTFYIGGNAGVLIGKNNKFGLDLGYYKWSASSVGLPQVGVGGRFLFSDNDNQGAPDRNMPTRKTKKKRKR